MNLTLRWFVRLPVLCQRRNLPHLYGRPGIPHAVGVNFQNFNVDFLRVVLTMRFIAEIEVVSTLT